jgi:hypothetical protein
MKTQTTTPSPIAPQPITNNHKPANANKTMKTSLRILAHAALFLVSGSLALAQQPTAQERVVALKASLASSQAILKQYEWVETTVISLKGEEKSRQMNRCYYGAEGKVQKVPLTTPPPAEKKRGLRGKILEKKTEELTDYMKEAVGLVKTYVPPSPTKIQAAKDAGKVSIDVLEPGKRARLNFRDYEKPGDNLGVEVNLANNRPLGVNVSTYLDEAKDAVTLDVRMGQLTDGTTYASDVTLIAKAKNLTVTVQNSGYRKAN